MKPTVNPISGLPTKRQVKNDLPQSSLPRESNYKSASEHTMAESSAESKSKTILIVDDQAVVLEFCRTMLEKAGYKVLSASSGEQALRFFEPNRSPIDLALIDIVMPAMSGIDLCKRLESLNTVVRIVMMSGYSPDEVKRVVGEPASLYRTMWKPFEARTLVQMIKNVLDEDIPKIVRVGQC